MTPVRMIVLIFVIALLSNSAALYAQQAKRGSGIALTVGIAWGGAVFGDDDPKRHSEFGITIGGQIWTQLSDSASFVLETTFQPNRIENPHFEEAFRALYLQPGIEFGERFYVRPSAGISIQSWSGKSSCNCVGSSFVLGIAGGKEHAIGNQFHVFPEATARASFAHGVYAYMLGLQVPVGWRYAE
jgi:hypothetical protein